MGQLRFHGWTAEIGLVGTLILEPLLENQSSIKPNV